MRILVLKSIFILELQRSLRQQGRSPELGISNVGTNMNNILNSRSTYFPRSFVDRNAGIGMNSGLNPKNANFEFGIGDPNLNSLANSGSANVGPFDLDKKDFKDFYGYSFPRVTVEKDADILHIKMLKNNTFVTVTDSNGNKKFGGSAGKLTKISRYTAKAIAEQIGRDARGRGMKSVVVKVNEFMYFKKKKQAILSLREGYSQSR